MPRFLPSPAFAYSDRILKWFDEYVEDHRDKVTRILIHPISEGLRFRNLADDRSATVEISGALVTVTTFIKGALADKIWQAEDEVEQICESLVTFFKPQE